eukprot:gene11494-12687_t
MATMQVTLRSDCNDEYSKEKSHRFVESKRNQRIEAWWSFFRKSRKTWWINFFKDLADKGHFLAGNEGNVFQRTLTNCERNDLTICQCPLEYTLHKKIKI